MINTITHLSKWSKVSLNAAVNACAGSRPGGLKDVSAVRSSGTCMQEPHKHLHQMAVVAIQDIPVAPMRNRISKLQTRVSVKQTNMSACQLHAYLAQALQSAVHVAGVAKVDQASWQRCTSLSFLFILHVLFKQDLF
jgi:hypothetical protein